MATKQLIHTVGKLLDIGTNAPDFTVTKTDLTDIKASDFKGQKVILNIYPSIETSVCSASESKFKFTLCRRRTSSINNTT